MAGTSLKQEFPDAEDSRRIEEGKKHDEQGPVEQSRSEEIERGKEREDG